MKRTHFLYQGLLLAALLTLILSCQLFEADKQQSPTGPQFSALAQANFWASEGTSEEFGVYKGNTYFLVQTPVGEYLLTYTTHAGTFFLVFRAERSAQLFIGLHTGDEVREAMLYTGTIRDTSNPVINGPITLYSELGASSSWRSLFAVDSSPGIPLIGGVGVKYIPGEVLELYLTLKGAYLLTYKTTLGTFEHEFTASKDNFVEAVGLQPGVEVLEAYVLKK